MDGTSLADQSFRGFGEGVLRSISRSCRSRKDSGQVLPVYYQPDQFGVRWQVGTSGTNLTYMMVEFPAPEEETPETEATPSGQDDATKP